MGLWVLFIMKVTKIRDDVWKFKGVGSVYLIRGKRNILIDTGDKQDREDLAREIEKVVPLDSINVVLLTHLHYDHLGGLDLFPDAEIFADEQEIADYMEDAEGFHFYASEGSDEVLRQKVRPLPNAISEVGARASNRHDPVEPNSMVGKIEGLGVLKVPGHTRGSVAFLDKKRKLLFSGDTIFGGGIVGRVDLPNSLPDNMDESVRMLRKLVVDEGLGLCPGHGYWEDQN